MPTRDRRARCRAAGPRREHAGRRAAGRAARRGSWPPRPRTSPPGGDAVGQASAATAARPRPAAVATTPRPCAPAAPVAFPTAEERAARRAPDLDRRLAAADRRRLAIVALGGWNLLLQATSSTPRGRTSTNVATVLDVAGQPGVADRDPDRGRRDRLGSGRGHADGEVTIAMRDLAPTTRQPGLRGLGDRRRRRPGRRSAASRSTAAGTACFEGTGLPTADGIVLALTLEPGPGATTPTMPIISKGVATAAG